jgi:hypothetical protein
MPPPVDRDDRLTYKECGFSSRNEGSGEIDRKALHGNSKLLLRQGKAKNGDGMRPGIMNNTLSVST